MNIARDLADRELFGAKLPRGPGGGTDPDTAAIRHQPSIPAHQAPDSGSTGRGAPAPRNRAERRQQARQRRRNRHR